MLRYLACIQKEDGASKICNNVKVKAIFYSVSFYNSSEEKDAVNQYENYPNCIFPWE